MVYKFINDATLAKARSNKIELYIPSVLLDTVSWDESFEHLTTVLKEPVPDIHYGPYLTIVTHTAHDDIDIIKDIIKDINVLEERANVDRIVEGHMYIGLTQFGGNLGPHSDDCEVLFWQCIGQTQWSVNDSIYVLNPGDCIYVPQGMQHDVKSLSPRMGISFGF
tara:strand:- start:393 stop:887 length:495 start_codon:yes stop_codon:yes gene_type:complete